MAPSMGCDVAALIDRFRAPLELVDAFTIDTQVAVASIPSPTMQEGARASWVQGAFENVGLEPRIDAVGNVLASLGQTSAPPVVVCAHLDTVFPDSVAHDVQTRGGRFLGPGIVDNARGLAGMLTLARVIHTSRLTTRHPLLFAATVCEEGEGDLRGARHLFATAGATAIAAFALDGAGDERIVTHAVGTRRFRVTVRGPGGHSWAASATPNPLHAVADLATRLSRLPMRAIARTTLAVTRVQGGEAVNAIPALATLDIEMRSPQLAVLDRGALDLRALLGAVLDYEQSRCSGPSDVLQGTITVTSNRPAGIAPTDSLPVQATVAATEYIGRTPELAIASTDANVPLSLGIPAVAIGAGGRGGDTHTPYEWFENRQGALGLARALASIVATAAGHA